MLFDICVPLFLPAVESSHSNVVSTLCVCWVDGEERAGCFAFLWLLIYVLSILVCLLLLLVSLVGYVL